MSLGISEDWLAVIFGLILIAIIRFGIVPAVPW